MARLFEYSFNNGDMIELAKYQKQVLPMTAGAEELSVSASESFNLNCDRMYASNSHITKP